MTILTPYRKQQFIYLLADIFSSLLVWFAFLWFRWMVNEGKVFTVDTILSATTIISIRVYSDILFVGLLYSSIS